MKTYSNQRILIPRLTPEEDVWGVQAPYSKFHHDEIFIAARMLSGAEFKLWIYMRSWMPNEPFAFSTSDVEKKLGLSRSTIGRAWAGLEDKGYIILLKGNYYMVKGKTDLTEDGNALLSKSELEQLIDEAEGNI